MSTYKPAHQPKHDPFFYTGYIEKNPNPFKITPNMFIYVSLSRIDISNHFNF